MSFRRFVRSLARFSLAPVPEYAVVVLLTGLFSGWLSDFAGIDRSLGVAAAVLVAGGTLAILAQ